MSLLNKITDYFRTSKSELEKVSWPSRQDTIRYSALVIATCILVSAFFAILDSSLTRLVDVTLTARQGQVQNTAPVVPTTVDASSTTLTPVTSGSIPINLNGSTPIKTPAAPAPAPAPAPTPSKK